MHKSKKYYNSISNDLTYNISISKIKVVEASFVKIKLSSLLRIT
jgi:hypothetical protein